MYKTTETKNVEAGYKPEHYFILVVPAKKTDGTVITINENDLVNLGGEDYLVRAVIPYVVQGTNTAYELVVRKYKV